MKANKLFYAMAMSLAVVACSPKETAAENTEEAAAPSTAAVTEAPDGTPHEPTLAEVTPSKSLVDSASYLYGIYLGSMLKNQGFGENMNLRAMKKGMLDFYKSCQDPADSLFATQFKIDPMSINEVITKYLSKQRELEAFTNKKKEADYFAKLDKNADIQKTESGVRYTVIEAGNPEVVAADEDTVFVHYTLTIEDGKVVDEVPAGAEPARIPVSAVVPGFREGLQLIGEGGKITIYVPSELGYGPYGNRDIPSYCPLKFDIIIEKVAAHAVAEETKAE